MSGARASAGRADTRRSPSRSKTVQRVSTGIRGLDEVLYGGLPQGRAVAIGGQPGTGKTILCAEFVYRGASERDEPGVLVTFEEPTAHLLENLGSFGWDIPGLVEAGRLAIVDASLSELSETEELDEHYSLAPVWARIRHALDRIGARRIAVDGLSSVFDRLGSRRAVRELFFRLCEDLGRLGVTSLISVEERGHYAYAAEADVVHFVADGLILLEMRFGQQQVVRSLTVKKLRGASYRSARVDFAFDEAGIVVFPKVPLDRHLARTSLRRRASTGVESLDQILGGGIPDGHVMLLSGNTGTGKTLTSLGFLHAGLEVGEPGVFVALDEAAEQLRRTASARRMSLARFERQGRLALLDAPLIDLYPDKLLYEIVTAAKRTGARRLVFDSLSSLESATMNYDDVREFVYQLVELAKSRGITCMLTFLMPQISAEGDVLAATDLRLSSVVDGIILMRYAQREHEVIRQMHVLKLRASKHERRIFEYRIERSRIRILSSSPGPDG